MPNPAYEQIISAYHGQHGDISGRTSKIPKGSKIEFTDPSGVRQTFVLPYSLLRDETRQQWFMIKPHSPEEKAERVIKRQSGGMLRSELVQIDDITKVMPTLEKLMSLNPTQIQKMWIIPEDSRPEVSAVLMRRAREVAGITTACMRTISGGKPYRATYFQRESSSQHHSPVRKVGLIIDFVSGTDLLTLLGKGQPSLLVTMDIIINVLKAVKSLHDAGIIHGDLKPEHFIMALDYLVKMVVDCEFASCEGVANGGGTPKYVAPEVYEHGSSFAADIFSVGVIICDLLGISKELDDRGDKIEKFYEKLRGKGGYQGDLAQVLEEHSRVVANVPRLVYEKVRASMEWDFSELNSQDQNFIKQLEPILRTMVEVINKLLEPQETDRMDINMALSVFGDLRARLLLQYAAKESEKYEGEDKELESLMRTVVASSASVPALSPAVAPVLAPAPAPAPAATSVVTPVLAPARSPTVTSAISELMAGAPSGSIGVSEEGSSSSLSLSEMQRPNSAPRMIYERDPSLLLWGRRKFASVSSLQEQGGRMPYYGLGTGAPAPRATVIRAGDGLSGAASAHGDGSKVKSQCS